MILVFVAYVFARLGLVGRMEAVGWSEVKLRPLHSHNTIHNAASGCCINRLHT